MKTRVHGHFGEWVQGRIGSEGPIGLVTVPCPALFLEAEWLSDGPLALDDPAGLLTLERCQAFLAALGGHLGQFAIRGNIPPGTGAGASTAALVSVARAASVCEGRIAEACVATEGASDPLMLPQPDRVLWAPREGRVLQDIAPLPRAAIVGGFWGAPQHTDPADEEFPDIGDLIQDMSKGLTLDRLAGIAASSATRTTAVRGPSGDPIHQLGKDLGALGYLRAHTGSARGLIFAPGAVPSGAIAALSEAGFKGVLHFETGGA